MQQQRVINNSSQLNMFRAIVLPIFKSTRLCVTACGIMNPRCCRLATSWVHYTTSCNTQSSAPEDGRLFCPKHVELNGIINKPLLLHLVGCLYYLQQYKFLIITRPVFRRMTNVAVKICRETKNIHFVFSNFSPKMVPFVT